MPQPQNSSRNTTRQSRLAAALDSRWSAMLIVALFVVIGLGSLIWAQAATTASSFWPENKVPKVLTESIADGVELGLKFRPSSDGTVTGMKFYKGPQNTGTHTGSLWTSDGRHLAAVTFTHETATGWQTAEFPEPVAVTAGTEYVVSYYAPNGHYSADVQYFARQFVNDGNTLRAPVAAGVYTYTSAAAKRFPDNSDRNTNYWVDVILSTSLLRS